MAGQETGERGVQLGHPIAEQRKGARSNQCKVAQGFRMSAAQLQEYEKGINRISAVHLEILGRLTATLVADFFFGIPQTEDLSVPSFAEETQKSLAGNNS